MATSAKTPGLPVPSMTVPPRITNSPMIFVLPAPSRQRSV
jgi:hypothetical protein